MQSRSRSARHWPTFSRAQQSLRLFQSRRSMAFLIRCMELCLLAGILLAFAAGMVRLR